MTVITSYAPGTFSWPGLCSADAAASGVFYSRLFGWEAVPMKMEGGDYVAFKLGGDTVCGMYEMAPDRKAAGVRPHWNSYLTVSDVDATARRAEELGGKVLLGPFDAEGDRMANLADPDGAKFSIWKMVKPMEPTRIGEPGTHCWTELCTRDSERAQAFYKELIGWKMKPFDGSEVPYTVIETGEGGNGIGGIFQLTPEMGEMPPQWVPYFQVEDADATAGLAKELGGTVHCVMDIPNAGRIGMIADNQGAPFCVIKPASM